MYNFEPEDYFEVDENFEFNTGINKLLEREVDKRLNERIDNYDHILEQNETLNSKIREMRSQISKLERELKEAEKTYLKQGSDDTKRQIFNGIKVGDKVWFAKGKYTYEKCNTCNGEKKLDVVLPNGDEVKINCPSCKGSGTFGKTTYHATEGKVTEIKYQVWNSERSSEMAFYVDYAGNYDTMQLNVGRDGYFFTKEECEAYIKEKYENDTVQKHA